MGFGSESDRTELSIAILHALNIRFKESEDQQLVSCPYHKDNKPSMSVCLSKSVCNCFACRTEAAHGSLAKLYADLTGQNAYKDFLGDRPHTESFRNPFDEGKQDKALAAHPVVRLEVRGNIADVEKTPVAYEYVHKTRGLTTEVVRQMKIGYASHVDVVNLDVFDTDDNGIVSDQPHVNHFTERITIPIYENHTLISLEGRAIYKSNDPKFRKVLYPRGSCVDTLYDIDTLDPNKVLYVAEGLMDLAMLRTAPDVFDPTNSTALFGAKIGDRQAYFLNKFPTIVYIRDNDPAGLGSLQSMMEKTTSEIYELLAPRGCKDIDDLAKIGVTLNHVLSTGWLRTAHLVKQRQFT